MSGKQLLFALCLAAACAPVALAQSAATKPQPRAEVEHALSMFGGGDNYIGVYTEPVTRENQSKYGLTGAPRGVAVTEVVENSPAAKAGLQKNDVIVAYDGERVTSTQKLVRLINESSPEHTARVTVWRGGGERDFSVTLGRRATGANLQGFRLKDGELFRFEGDQWKKQAEEWSKQGEAWKKNAEQWRKQAEELRKQFKEMPRGENFSFGYVLGAGRRIGVTTTPLTDQLADYFGVSDHSGLLVTSVTADSPAAKAGIKAGDVITEAEGEKVKSAGDLSRAINRKDEGEVTLTVVRERSRRTFRLTPEKTSHTFTTPEGGLFTLPDAAGLSLRRLNMTTPRVTMPRVTMPRVFMPAFRPLALPRVTTPRVVPAHIRPVQLLEL